MLNFLLLLGLSISAHAEAPGSISVLGRATNYSCSYFSQRVAEVLFVFEKGNLSEDSSVVIEIGLEVHSSKYTPGGEMETLQYWVDRQQVEMHWNGRSWVAMRDIRVLQRGSPDINAAALFRYQVNGKWQGRGYGRVSLTELTPQCLTNGNKPQHDMVQLETVWLPYQ